MAERDPYTALGAWVHAQLKAQFGDAAIIREDGKRDGDPEGKAYVYTIEPLPDRTFARGTTALNRFSVTVRVIDKVQSTWPLGPDAEGIQLKFGERQNEELTGGYTLVSCRRESPFRPPPVIFKGVEYRQLGASYRALLQERG